MNFVVHAIDVETASTVDQKYAVLPHHKSFVLRGLGYAGSDGARGWLTDPKAIADYLDDAVSRGIRFAAHNGKFERKVLRRHAGREVNIWFDTQLAAGIMPGNRPLSLALDRVVAHYLGVSSWKEDEILANTAAVDSETLGAYCLTDCDYTLRLARKLYESLGSHCLHDFFFGFIMPVSHILCDAEDRGIRVNLQELDQLLVRQGAEVRSIRDKILVEHADLFNRLAEAGKKTFKPNPASNKQVLGIFKLLGLPHLNYKGKESTDTAILEAAESRHPIVPDLLRFREATKTLQFYEAWEESAMQTPEEGVVRCRFNMDVTRTGRLSCADPNMQQVPSDPAIRSLFVARPGHKFVVVDYSQIEPRVAAHYSEDPKLVDVYRKGGDLYSTILKESIPWIKKSVEEIRHDKPLRAVGKELGLSVLYGIGPTRLAYRLSAAMREHGIAGPQGDFTISYKDAAQIRDNFFNNFGGLSKLMLDAQNEAIKLGYVTNLVGRKVPVTGDDIYRCAVNRKIQSSASDICLTGMRAVVSEWSDWYTRELFAPLLQVHDEVVWEVSDEIVGQFAAEVGVAMVRPFQWLKVPLLAEVFSGGTWACK